MRSYAERVLYQLLVAVHELDEVRHRPRFEARAVHVNVDAAGPVDGRARLADRANDRLERVQVLVAENRRDDLAVDGTRQRTIPHDLPNAAGGVRDLRRQNVQGGTRQGAMDRAGEDGVGAADRFNLNPEL